MNAAGLALLKEFEGFRERAYQDIVGTWTIGYGFTEGVQPGDYMTREQADERLGRELARYEQAVRVSCAIPPNENELAALTCFSWNVGIAGMRRSSVLRAHNRGDHDAAARAFALWNQAGGQVVRGLTRRRAAEAALYLKPSHAAIQQPMPQKVDPESKMQESTIVRGTTVTAGAAILATLSEGATAVRNIAEQIGVADWLPYVLLVVVLAGAGYVIWQRVKQRRGGWA